MKELLLSPVLVKELKLRFRSFKSFSGLIFYLLVLVIFVTGSLLMATQFSVSGFFRPSDSFDMFVVLSVIQMALVMFITPGLTAGAISTERERQTLNILLTTTQTSTQIIIGKLLSSVAFLILMLIAGLPLYSLVFLFGGVAPWQFIMMFLLYLVTLITIGSIGIMFSTITKRTIVSIIATYGTMIFLGVITAFFFFIGVAMEERAIIQSTQPNATPFAPIAYFWASINPGALILTLIDPDTQQMLVNMVGISFPIWIIYLIFYTLMTIICLTIAIRKLRANMKSNR